MKKLHVLFLLPFFLLMITGGNTYAVDYYWVGGTGNWSDYATHWATSSGGGTFHTQVPTSADNVIFDISSFNTSGQTVTINQTIVSCLNMNWTGVANTPKLSFGNTTYVLQIYGSLTMVSGMTIGTTAGNFKFTSTTTGKTITTAGLNLNSNVVFDGIGGGWTLQDNLSSGPGGLSPIGIVTFNNGSLNTNNKTVSVAKFISTGSGTRTLTLGSSVLNISHYSTNGWQIAGTNMTLNAGTSTINMTCNSSGWSPDFKGGGKTYNNVNFTGASSLEGIISDGGSTFVGDVSFAAGGKINPSPSTANTFNGTVTFYKAGTITSSNTFNNLTFSPGFTYILTAGKTQSINGTLSVTGTCTAAMEIKSSTASPTTISKASGSVAADYITLTKVAGTGGATFTANHAIDGGGNTGWTITPLVAQNLYWIGGTGNWSDGNHWSLTSGGSAYGCAPSLLDDVFFDANSFSGSGQSVTADLASASCKNMTWTGVTNTPQLKASINTNALNIYGSLTLVSGMTIGSTTAVVNFRATATGKTVTTAGLNLNTNVTFDGIGGGWTLQDDFTLGTGAYNTMGITLNNGILNTNNKTVTAGKFVSSGSGARTLDLGFSVVNIAYYSTNGWQIAGTNMTLNAGTSTINMTCNISGWSPDFKGGGKTYNNVNFTGASSLEGIISDGGSTFAGDVSFAAGGKINPSTANTFNGTVTFYKAGTITSSNTFNNLTFSPGFTYTLTAGKSQTINGTLSANGTCSLGIIIKSSTASPTTISKASGAVTVSSVTLTSVVGTGGATFTANASIDGGGNTGWTINSGSSQDLYWVGGTGNWSDGNHWATSSGGTPVGCAPGVGDNVFFDANSFSGSGQSVTIDLSNANCKDMTWTGVTNTPQLIASVNTNALNIYGSLTLVSGMTIGSTTAVVNFRATTTGKTVTTAGLNLNTNVTFDGIGGGWTLQDDFTLGTGAYNTMGITLNNGSLNTNNKTVTAGKFTSEGSGTRTMDLGTSVLNFAYYSLYAWKIAGTNMTLNAGTSTINMTCNQSGWTPYFQGGGKTYNNVNFTGASSLEGCIYDGGNIFNGDVSFAAGGNINPSPSTANTFNGTVTFYKDGAITSSNTFNNLTFSPGFTYTLTAGKTQTITGDLNISGTGGYPIRVQSSTLGSPYTFSKASGTVCADYLRISDNTATGGAAFNAGVNSQDMGGNTGWNFNFPAAPVATAGSAVTSSQFTANWYTVTGATEYFLDVSTDNLFGSFVPGYSNLNVGNVTSKNVTGLSASTTYYYRVRANTVCGLSGNSNVISVLTNSGSGACPDMIGGTATPSYSIICTGTNQLLNTNGSGGTLQWQYSTDNISWTDIGGAINASYTTPNGNVTPFSGAGSKAYFRCLVKSSGCFNVSSTSVAVEVSNPSITVTVAGKTDNSITLDWSPVGGGNYDIDYDGTSSGSGSSVTPPYTISGLTASGTYNITVTQTGLSCSASGILTGVKTLCAVPTGVTLSSPANKQLKVDWTGDAGDYRVYYREVVIQGGYLYKDVTTTGNSGTTTITNLYGGGTYEVYVVRKDCPSPGVFGQKSALAHTTVKPLSACTPLPTIDEVKSTCPGQIEVTMSGSPTGKYVVFIQRLTPTVAGAYKYNVNGGTFQVNVGQPGQTFSVGVASKCLAGTSDMVMYPGGITIKPLCNPIGNLVLSHATCNGFTASWNREVCSENQVGTYQVFMKKTGALTWNSYPVSSPAPPISPFLKVNWLGKGYNMSCYVKANYSCNGYVIGGPSSTVQTITTLSAGCREEGEEMLTPETPSTQIIAADNSEAISIYPNPNNGQFQLDISRMSNDQQQVMIEVMNVLGQTVLTRISEAKDGHGNEIITIPETAAAGTYFVRVTVGSNTYTAKVNVSR